MNNISQRRRATSPVAKLSAVALTCLIMLPQAEASVVWVATDSIFDGLVLETTGQITISSDSILDPDLAWSGGVITGNSVPYLDVFGMQNLGDSVTSARGLSPASTASVLSPLSIFPTTISGDTFYIENMFGGGADASLTVSGSVILGGLIAPNSKMTFAGETVNSVFGTSLDNGPLLLWTDNITGATISVATDDLSACPEPSGVLSLGALLGLGLMFRTRR